MYLRDEIRLINVRCIYLPVAFPPRGKICPLHCRSCPTLPGGSHPEPIRAGQDSLKGVNARIEAVISISQKGRPKASMRFSKAGWHSKARDRKTKPVVDLVERTDLGWREQVFPLTCDRGRANRGVVGPLRPRFAIVGPTGISTCFPTMPRRWAT